MHWVIGIAAAVLAVVFCSGPTVAPNRDDRRLEDLSAKHTEQQTVQNQRLAELQHQWQTERSDLYQQRDQLESERRDLADQRHRDPIVAQSILQLGSLTLGLLPLAVAALLLRRSTQPDEGDLIAETLVSDLMSAQPTVFASGLPSPQSPAGRLGAAENQPFTNPEPPSP